MTLKIKNIKHLFIIAGFLIGIFPFASAAAAGTEAINHFKSDIAIQKNADALVTETITYDFGSNQKHGIIRTIPTESPDGPTISINVMGVTDENGKLIPYNISQEGNNLNIKIGNPNQLVSGTKTYIISYSVKNAIRNFDDHDELYWNVTGNDWLVGVQDAAATVSLPQAFPLSQIKSDCFTGVEGSTAKACAFTYPPGFSASTSNKILYATTQALNPQEGLTIVAGFPTGVLPKSLGANLNSSQNSKKGGLTLVVIFGLLFLIILGWMISLKVRKGRARVPKELKNRPIIVEYAPPENLTPPDVGAIFDGNLDDADLASVIVDLAVKGYLKIKYLNNNDFEFVKIKNLDGISHPAYQITFDFLFKNQNNISLSELENQNRGLDKDRAIDEMEKKLLDSGYIKVLNDKDPEVKKQYCLRYLGVFLTIFLLVYIPVYIAFGGVEKLKISGVVFFIIFCGIIAVGLGAVVIAMVFGKPVFGSLSPSGIEALSKILGFKEFLRATETDKLKLTNAPELKPELFDRYLPYAMALWVEKEWAKKFEGLYTMLPAWYDGPERSFNTTRFVSRFSRINKSFTAKGKHSSGFHGGSSGRGSGGGGGRSW